MEKRKRWKRKVSWAVIDYNGKSEGRVFDDVKNVGITLEKLQDIAGSNVESEVALCMNSKTDGQ